MCYFQSNCHVCCLLVGQKEERLGVGLLWRAVEAHEVMDQTCRKAASLALLPLEKFLINWNSFSGFWSASMFLNSSFYKKNTFFVCSAALYLKDRKENAVQGWGTLISQAVSEMKGYVVVEKWLELLLKVT